MSNIQRISTVIFYILAGLSLIFAGMYYFGGSVPETIGTTYEAKNFTSLVLVWAVILFIITGIATLLFSFAHIFSSGKIMKNFLVVLGLAVVLIVVSYLLASSLPLSILHEDIPTPTATTLKWVGTGLNATYILAILAFFGIIFSEVIRVFK
jgi:NADH:ubiquinone oxidoreductase subunit 6 (subunit J)